LEIVKKYWPIVCITHEAVELTETDVVVWCISITLFDTVTDNERGVLIGE
jgi:hypothetical protein